MCLSGPSERLRARLRILERRLSGLEACRGLKHPASTLAEAEVFATFHHQDSNLCVRTLNEWAPSWKKRGWKKATGEEVKNVDLVRKSALDALESRISLLERVRGNDDAKDSSSGNVGASLRMDAMSCRGVSAWKGVAPVASSPTRIPRAHQSTATP